MKKSRGVQFFSVILFYKFYLFWIFGAKIWLEHIVNV